MKLLMCRSNGETLNSVKEKALSFKCDLFRLLDSEALFCITVVVLFFVFYTEMVDGYLTTHDEIQTIYEISNGSYFSTQINGYLASLRGLFIVDSFLQYPQSLYVSEEVYRLFDVAAIALSVLFAYRFFSNISNKSFARLFVVGFLACMTLFPYEHNAFLAFGYTYKLKIGFAFLLLNLVLKFAKSLDRRYLVLSVVLYVVLSAWYESFIFMCVPIALIVLYTFWSNNFLSIARVLKVFLAFAIPEAIYICFYIWASLHVGFSYDGTSVASDVTLKDFFQTAFTLMMGDMPFSWKVLSEQELVERVTDLTPETIAFWIKGMILAGIAARLLCKNEMPEKRNFLFVFILCLVSAFALCIPFGISARYVSWVVEGGTRGYGISYYTYYFLIAAFASLVSYIAAFAKAHSKVLFNIMVGLLFVAVTLLSVYTDVNNQVNIDFMQKAENKGEAFVGIMDKQLVGEIPEGSIIYTDDYIGIHNQIDTLSSLADSQNGRGFVFTNERNFDENASFYWLRYDEESNLASLSRYDSGEVSEVILYSEEDISKLTGEIRLAEGATPTFHLNGAEMYTTDQTAVFSLGYNNASLHDSVLFAEGIDSVVVGSCVLEATT